MVEFPARVEAQDIPDGIMSSLPGISFLTMLYLEGSSSERLVKLAQSTAKEAAKHIHGIVFNPQTDRLIVPGGVKRTRTDLYKRDERFTALSLSWWFLDDSPLSEEHGRAELLHLIEQSIPECLPRRYGTYEPLQHKYMETGREHFLPF